jgi:hypothetical protein
VRNRENENSVDCNGSRARLSMFFNCNSASGVIATGSLARA